MYIGDYLARRKLYTPGKLAFIDAGKKPEWRLTYEDMNTRANRLADWFFNVAQVNKGDRVAILARDGIEHLDTFFACSKIGAVHTALNWRLHWREILVILRNTTPKVLIYSDEFRENIAHIQSSLADNPPMVQHYIHIEGTGVSGSEHYEFLLQNSSSQSVTCEDLIAEDIAALIFTGGTSGDPKAAQISHRMIAWNTLNTVIHDVHHDDIYLNVFPLFHTGGLFVYTLPQVIMGGTLTKEQQIRLVRLP